MRWMRGRVAGAVIAVAIVSAGLACPSVAQAATIQPVPLSGRLMVAHGDSFTGGAMVMQAELQTTAGVVPLELPASAHAQALSLAGRSVTVVGARLSASHSVTSIAGTSLVAVPAARAAVSVGGKRPLRIAVVLMRLPGSAAEPVSRASAQASTFGATNSVANWFSEMSGGQVAVTGAVYGYYAGVRSCDLATQLRAATAAATAHGYVASDYDSLVVYAPAQACDFAGIAWVGANGVFLNGTVDRGVMEHELGHNLGLLHAGEYECGVAPLSASCLVDYGDPTDVMGAASTNYGYDAQHKYALGWLPSSEVATVTSGTQTIKLTASENPLVAGSTELIHVVAADGTMYAIDRRASVGYDKGLSGVWIRRVADVNTDDTELVRSGALAPGQTFTDAAHRVTIETLTDSGAAALVRVCVGPCTVPVSTQTTGAASAVGATQHGLSSALYDAIHRGSPV